jgi:hypothetical protein
LARQSDREIAEGIKTALDKQIDEIRAKLKITKDKVNNKFDEETQKKCFIKCFQALGTISHAAQCMWIQAGRVYKWLDDPDTGAAFEKRMQRAHRIFADELEQIAFSRARFGTSDTMLIFLLKGHVPERYGERFQIDHSGKITTVVNGPLDLVRLAHEVNKTTEEKPALH